MNQYKPIEPPPLVEPPLLRESQIFVSEDHQKFLRAKKILKNPLFPLRKPLKFFSRFARNRLIEYFKGQISPSGRFCVSTGGTFVYF